MSIDTGSKNELDLQAILKKAEQQTDFPDVPLDEFTPPTYEEWKEACITLLKGAPFDKKMYTKTYEGITFEPMYFRADTEKILPKDSFPGMGDFLRGTEPNGYVGKPWGIAQVCDEALPSENNKLLRHEQEKGSTIYHIRLDSASLAGRNESDTPGDSGVSVATLDDMRTLLADLKLNEYPLYVFAGESALPLLSLTVAALKDQDLGKLTGFIGADPIGELVVRGKNSAPLNKLFDDIATAESILRGLASPLRGVLVRGGIFTLGGANDVQEGAFSLSTAVSYLRAMLERGIKIDEAAKQIMFSFSLGANFFLQIAKLRALRPLWAQIVGAFGGGKEAQKMHIHAKPSLFFKTVYDPYVNMLRNTTEIFSGVVGGLDSLESSPFDEPIRKGDEFSRRIARNIQIALQEEFGLLQPIDPAGGSWAVETLTRQMQEKIWAEFQTVEGKGGIVKALTEGYPQAQIAEVLEARFKAAETRKDRIVGNNMYPNMTEKLLEERPDNTAQIKQERRAAIDAFLAKTNAEDKKAKLAALKNSPTDGQAALGAAKAGATLGEIAAALHEGAGESETITPILPHRWSERFESLRKLTEEYRDKNGDNVKIFLANMGPIPQHKARADFTTGFLQVGAFEVLGNNGFATVEEAAAAAKESGADAVVICSTDATYPEIVPALAPKLHEALPKATVFLAGAAPKELADTYKAAGIDEYISVKANCYKILQLLQQKKGMIA